MPMKACTEWLYAIVNDNVSKMLFIAVVFAILNYYHISCFLLIRHSSSCHINAHISFAFSLYLSLSLFLSTSVLVYIEHDFYFFISKHARAHVIDSHFSFFRFWYAGIYACAQHYFVLEIPFMVRKHCCLAVSECEWDESKIRDALASWRGKFFFYKALLILGA